LLDSEGDGSGNEAGIANINSADYGIDNKLSEAENESGGKMPKLYNRIAIQLWIKIAELWVEISIAMAGCQNWVCR
jgi:hypothetical protein